MLLFNAMWSVWTQGCSRFKYIQCYYSTPCGQCGRKGVQDLNTSNVIIQRQVSKKAAAAHRYLNTSNVIIQRSAARFFCPLNKI